MDRNWSEGVLFFFFGFLLNVLNFSLSFVLIMKLGGAVACSYGG